jgi:hypothetical protein
MASKPSRLKYKKNWELRQELVTIANPDRRHEYGPARSGICKADLLDVASHVGVTYDETPTLSKLYRDLCDVAGTEYPSTAGQEWGLRRDTLKQLLDVAETTSDSAPDRPGGSDE